MSKPDFTELQYAFAKHLRDPERFPAPAGIEDRRANVYSELFFNNVRSLLSGTFPVIHRLLGSDRWSELVRTFYREHVSHTPFFNELPREFVEWLGSSSPDGQWPGFIAELAHHEWLELDVTVDLAEVDSPGVDANGDVLADIPVISPVARLAAYRFPVHRIGPGFEPEEPGEHPVFLVVHRKRDDSVSFTEVNAVTAELFERIRINTHESGKALLERLAHDMGNETIDFVEGGKRILEEMARNEIIAGTRPREDQASVSSINANALPSEST